MSNMENVQRFCGLSYDESYVVWDSDINTFGHCFLWTCPGYISHAIVLITCAYVFGTSKRTLAAGRIQKRVLLFNIVTWLLALVPLTEAVVSYAVRSSHPPAYVLFKCLSFSSWLSCLMVQHQTKSLSKQKKVNTSKIFFSFTFVLISSSLHLHYCIKHLLSIQKLTWATVSVQSYGIIIYAFLNCIFFICCCMILLSKAKRTSFNRSISSLGPDWRVQTSVQEEDSYSEDGEGEEDFDVSYSGNEALISSTQSQNSYYTAYQKHKTDKTDIYLGKAEEGANPFSKLVFWWANKLISKGYHDQLKNAEDLFSLPPNLDTKMIKEIFSSMMRIQRQKSLMYDMRTEVMSVYDMHGQPRKRRVQISMLKSLHRAFGKSYYLLGIIKFLVDCFSFAGPVLLNLLVGFMENQKV